MSVAGRRPTADSLCDLKSRALRKLPDGNFRRPLVGSLRALTSAEMVAPRGIAAARTGFLLAALHSVAERVNPRKARPPSPHCARVLTSATLPHLAGLGEERATPGSQVELERADLRSFHPGAQAAMARRWERSCGSCGGGVRWGLRANGDTPRRLVRLRMADSLCDRMERGEEEAHDRRGVASQRSQFCGCEGGPLPTSDRQERKWGHSPIPRFAGKWGQTSKVRSDTSRRQMRSDPIC